MNQTALLKEPHRLKAYGKNIWAVRSSLAMGPMDISTQMSVVRLPDGSIVLISPIAMDNSLQEQINALGRVTYIISPNNFHHLFANQAQATFPNAQFICPDALVKRVKSLPSHLDLHTLNPDVWQGQIETLRISPSHMADEVVFYHGESKTLIVTDLLQHMSGNMTFFSRLFARMAGIHHKLRVSRLFKLMVKNKQEFREAFSSIQTWDYENVLLPHNSNVLTNARARVQQAIDAFG